MELVQYGLGRWLHILAGVMWVGLLYYFNFVQAAAMKDAQADGTAAGIAKHVAPRALFWFRWAAVVTWLAGMMLLGDKAVKFVPIAWVHRIAAAVFALLGLVVLAGWAPMA